MPSTVEQLSPTRVKLTVEIPFAELQPHLDKAYQEIAGQVNIPGFRKGKVPPAIIDQRFGRGVVLQEAINDALPQAYNAAVSEHKVVPMGQPEVEVTKLEDKDLVEFTAEVDVRPTFDLPDFSGITAEVENVAADDSAIDERIELLRQRFATNTDVERAAQDGDVVTLDLTASRDGELLEDAEATGVTYKIGSDQAMLDGLAEAVTGLKAGESNTFTSKLVGGKYRDQDAEIEVTVTKVQEQELPALDDEFAQMISEFDTVDEMRADLAKAVQQQAALEQQAQGRDKVLEAAIAATDFELPEAALKAELDARRKQIENQLAQAGMTVDDYLENSEDEDAEDADAFWKQIDERSEQALRAHVILDSYADANSLDVSQQELTELIFRKAQENGSSPQDEVNHMMEHGHMADWMQEIRRSKALVAMVTSATVKDADGNVVEFDVPAEAGDAVDAEPTPADIASSSVESSGADAAADEPKKPAAKRTRKKADPAE